jgi:hypothetical protein
VTDLGAPLDAQDLELLREGAPVDPAVKERVRARLRMVVPSMALAAGAGAAAMPRTGRPATYATQAIAAAAFVAGGVLGAVLYAKLGPSTAPQIVFVDRPVPAPTSSGLPVSPPESPSALPAPVASSQSVQSASPNRGLPSQLSAERKVLDEARGALLRGEGQQALDALERHRRTFPSPLLGEERDALQVQALVKAGRYAEARARGEAFGRRFPDSFYLPMVNAALASIP